MELGWNKDWGTFLVWVHFGLGLGSNKVEGVIRLTVLSGLG